MNASSNIQYCVKCDRPATKKDILGLPKCDFHIDPDIEESEIPTYEGEIPEGSVCFEEGCQETPTKIFGGACFCEKHYQEAKRGDRYNRKLFD